MKISTNIKERILYIADLKEIKKDDFIESLNQKYSNYRGISKKSAPSAEVLAEISTKYPDVNITWILTGKGTPLKDELRKEVNQNILGHNNTLVGNDLITDNSLTIQLLMTQVEDCKKIIAEKDAQINKLLNIMSYEKK